MADTTFGYFNQTAGVAQAGYGLYQQIDRAIHGDKYKVHFIVGNKTLVEFDACLNESHTQQAAPTSFPIQSGGAITDHIAVAPLTLNITGVVTDSPITDFPDIKTQAVIAGANAVASKVASAVGVLAVAGVYALGAQRGSVSRSIAAYAMLTKMVSGYVNGRQLNRPILFNVVTRLRDYTNMCLTELRVDRDSSTGNALVFSMGLTQIRRAYSYTKLVTVAAEPEKAAVKAVKAQAEADERKAEADDLLGALPQGVAATDRVGQSLSAGTLVPYANGL